MISVKEVLGGLTLEELRDWAGAKIFNRGKGYISAVSQLSCLEDGTLAAWVAGTKEYATWVSWSNDDGFDYDCTCPFDYGPCKHAVAVFLAAVEKVNKKQEIPLLDFDDELYFEAFEEDEDWEEEDWDDEAESSLLKNKAVSQIESMLSGKTRNELQKLLTDLALDYPDVFQRLRDSMQLESGQVDKLVRSLRREIRDLGSEDAWYNPWEDDGNLPDYSRVEEQLQKLLDNGFNDEVVDLGKELWRESEMQVAEAHDDNATAMAISSCLSIVMRALPKSTMTPAEQLLWLIRHNLEDEYNLLESVEFVIRDEQFTESVWAEAASEIEEWMAEDAGGKGEDHFHDYRRSVMLRWLSDAYRKSGQKTKIIPLLEEETQKTGCYSQLVDTLIEDGKNDQARKWCLQGIKKTRNKWWGIAAELQRKLKELAEIGGRDDLAAAYLADEFFEHPSESRYEDTRLASEKIGQWPEVRTGLLFFLETGSRPGSKGKGSFPWPLPDLEVSTKGSRSKGRPDLDMLIRIALFEKRNDDAVQIYSNMSEKDHLHRSTLESLADKVAGSDSDIALQIWQRIAETLINLVKPKAYLEASAYMRRMKTLYEKNDRIEEWNDFVLRLRKQHKAKRRLMEVLNNLTGERNLLIK